ncbi:MAG: hypothetical protein U1F61_03700 [Opitutaceae bacterium]
MPPRRRLLAFAHRLVIAVLAGGCVLPMTAQDRPGPGASASPAKPAPAPAPAAKPSPGTALLQAAPGATDRSYNSTGEPARTAREQQASFKLPEGFEIELVAAETEGIGKFITVTWDARMRLWTMTALEYPVDANENKTASDALFARGGRDRVVVFDSPYGPPDPDHGTAGTPRVFADGLVMPLGVQPYRGGAFVQYGADIRFYRDATGDGRADSHEVVVTGFGTEDSHLFPHQFHRQPGGWMMVAQGAFNYSKVKRPDGRPFADGSLEVPFNQCKLGRLRLDGTAWENLTAGPNNIWGLATSRTGETFMQEANDMGYPVIPYQPGIWVRTLSREKLRPYQPLMPPPLEKPVMGGTGLSGLALAEDRDGHFRRVAGDTAAEVFYLANPITGTVQIVRAFEDGGRYRYEKIDDFLTSTDRWFRPIAVHFGPDGALYLVDWYNRIISHNEVPREHPDRDRVRGRIWRVRHRDQSRTPPPDLTRLDDAAVLAQVGGPNALVSRLAWLELIDRRATGLLPSLRALALDSSAAVDRRLGALWAWEGLERVPTSTLGALARDPQVPLRREALRIAGNQALPDADFSRVAEGRVDDPHPSVRAALGDALRRIPGAGAGTVRLACQLARPSLATGSIWEKYEREFERYLARWALETHPDATRAYLASPEGRALPVDHRLVALLALGDRAAALELARATAGLRRPFSDEEVRLLVLHQTEPAVRDALAAAIAAPLHRTSTLQALVRFRPELDPEALRPMLVDPVRALLSSPDPTDQALGADTVAAYKVTDAASGLSRVLGAHLDPARGTLNATGLAALRALRAVGVAPLDSLELILRLSTDRDPRNEAIAALAENDTPAAASRLVALLPGLSPSERGRALEKLTGTATGTHAVIAGIKAGTVTDADLGFVTVDRMRTVLPQDADVANLWTRLGGDTLASASAEAGIPLTPAEAAAQAETYARFRSLSNLPGNPEHGRQVFETLCLICHVQGGRGGQIGPALDGVGLTGIDAILRNVLTPSAAMEGAYRTYRVIFKDGSILEGFLVSEDAAWVTLRLPGTPGERRIARAEVRSASFLRRSLMPAGLLEGLPPEHARDLLSYLKGLK